MGILGWRVFDAGPIPGTTGAEYLHAAVGEGERRREQSLEGVGGRRAHGLP